jgi:hypothetical protein
MMRSNHVDRELGDSTRAGDLADEIVGRVSKHIKTHPGPLHSLGALCRVAAENYIKTIKKRERRIDFRGLGRDIEATLQPAAVDLQRELELWICADQALRGEDAEFRGMLQRRLMDETWREVGIAFGMTGEQAHQLWFGCATWKWRSCRPACRPVVFKAAVEVTAPQGEDGICAADGPEHAGPFEA